MSEQSNVNAQYGNSRITYSVTRQVPPRLEAEYDAIMQGTLEAARGFEGYIDTHVFRPTRTDRTYRAVVRFESEEHLRRWKQSPERQMWIERGDKLIGEPPSYANLTGTAQERRLAMVVTPLQSFVQTSVSGIGLLLLGTVLALILANSPLSDRYDAFWDAHLAIGTDRLSLIHI